MSLCLLHLLGASGTGRTTFVNTLCESEVLSHKVSDSPETAHVEEGIRIKPANVGALPPSATNHSFSTAEPLPF
jgi:septin family protein